jgi:hypothetical protein
MGSMTSALVRPSVEQERRPSPAKGSHAALVVFALAAVVAFFAYLVIGRHMWFFGDDWDFLAGRSIRPGDLFRSHGGHLVALPAFVYRVLYTVVGLRSYVPYMTLSILAHVAVACLLRVVMRRAGVAPWIATAAAGLYLFFGTGGQDIVWGFQITFVGAVVFGLVQMLYADHDGPIARRDWFGLAAGLVAILCSGVAVAMVAAVGLATLIRRGWRPALFHTIPLGVLYGAWWWHSDHSQFVVRNAEVLWRWDRHGFGALFDSFGQIAFLGWIFGTMLVVGAYFAWSQRGSKLARAELAAPFALLVAAPLFMTVTGATRAALGIFRGESSRYLDVLAALVLPALAVAGDALARRWRYLAPAVIVLFLLGIPANMTKTTDALPKAQATREYRRLIESLPRSKIATQVPRSVRPDPNNAPAVTIGWLIDSAKSGRLPGKGPRSAKEEATDALRLSIAETFGAPTRPPCTRLDTPVERHIERGGKLVVRGSVALQLLQSDGSLSNWVVLGDSLHAGQGLHTLTATTGPLTLYVGPSSVVTAAGIVPAICE